MDNLTLGPRNSTLDRFDQKRFFSEIDELHTNLQSKKYTKCKYEKTITENVNTIPYIKKYKAKVIKSTNDMKITEGKKFY